MDRTKELEDEVNTLRTKIKRTESDIKTIGDSDAILFKLEALKSLLKIKQKEFEIRKELYPYYKETSTEKRTRQAKEKQILFDSYQKESKLTSIKHGEPYEDLEMEEILECDDNDFIKILELAKRFERTWSAIKTITFQRDYYLKNGKFSLEHMPGTDHYSGQIKKLIIKNII